MQATTPLHGTPVPVPYGINMMPLSVPGDPWFNNQVCVHFQDPDNGNSRKLDENLITLYNACVYIMYDVRVKVTYINIRVYISHYEAYNAYTLGILHAHV